MNKEIQDDGQDFDALSEDSFDFGHFHELDSDADEPEVEHQTLDPFTAAQREESLLLGEGDADDVETDEKFAFTQRLLTNAQTLKELRASGAPEIEIEYDREAEQRVSSPETLEHKHESSSFHVASQLDETSSRPVVPVGAIYSQLDPRSQKTIPDDEYVRPYISLTQRSFRSLHRLGDQSLVQGKHIAFPAHLLKAYSFELCRTLLDQTRLYTLDPAYCSHRICLRDIFLGKALRDCPVYKIRLHHTKNVILEDVHEEQDSCRVLAILEGTVDDLPPLVEDHATYVKLIEFHYDHAAKMKHREARAMTSKNVTIAEVSDESFIDGSQSSRPFPAAQESLFENAEVPAAMPATQTRSILRITRCEVVEIDEVRAQQARREEMKRMFETDLPLTQVGTQATVETDYSDPFGEHLNMNDFPVEGRSASLGV